VTTPELHYETIQTRGLKFEVATAGQGDRLALLLHGFPESAYSWRHQIPALVQLGYRVWAPNLRGYGNTDRPVGVAHYTSAQLEGDVSDLIDASGARSVVLIGHDWGGSIAWSYAMHGTRPIERLVVLNFPHPKVFARGLQTAAQRRRSWYMLAFQLPVLPELLISAQHARSLELTIRRFAVHPERFPDEVIAHYRDQASRPGALTAMINYYRAMGRTMLRRALGRGPQRKGAKILLPTLLIWGEQDRALGKELAQGHERYVDKLTLRMLPDASHWVQQDAPEEVNALLAAWLTETTAEQLSTSDVLESGVVSEP
jgi:epoxide hydrolase 4